MRRVGLGIFLVLFCAEAVYSEGANKPAVIRTKIPFAKPRALPFSFDGTQYSPSVTLAHLFPKKVFRGYGGLCHLLASVSLVEAMCSKLFSEGMIHRPISLSEGYLAHRHFLARLSTASVALADIRVGDGKYIAALDGGNPKATLDRIFNEPSLDRSQLSFETFDSILSGILSLVRSEEFSDGKARAARIADLLALEFRDFGAKRSPELEACLTQLEKPTVYLKPRTGLLLDFLSEGLPFVCSTRVTYIEEGISGNHSVLVIGYEYDENRPSKIRFLSRDTNFESPVWLEPGDERSFFCETANVIKKKNI